VKKNVLWVNHFLPYPPRGGLIIRTNSLLKEVSKHHNVTLVSLVQPRLVAPYFDTVSEGVEQIRQWCEANNIKLHAFHMSSEKSKISRYYTAIRSLFSSKPYSVNWLVSPEMNEFLSTKLDTTQFDVVHIDTMGMLVNLEGLNLPDSVIINHHNAEHIMMARRAKKETNLLKSIYYTLEARKIFSYDSQKAQKFKSHIACSKPDAEEIEKLGSGVSATVVPNGVTVKPEVFRNPIQGQFLFVGGLDWYPNTDAIIFLLREIAPLLKDKADKIQIDIVGKNPNEAIVAAAEQFEFVTLHGYVDDIDTMYANAQAFICPLRDGGGTKLKVLDAMMHGLPVIGTDIAFEGIDTRDGETGYICNDAQSIVNLLVAMADSSSEQFESVGQAGRQLVVSNYNATSIAQSYSNQISQNQ